MLKLEKKCRSFVMEHISLIAMLVVLIMGIVVRWSLVPFISGDFQNFNMPWLKEMRRIGGNAMVADGRFNYSPLFFYFFKLIGDLFPNGDALLLCKGMSLLPEMLTSALCIWALCRMQPRKSALFSFVTFCAFWLNPILILNASAWGQLDCCYALFSLLAVWLLIQKHPVWAIAALAVSCSWKLQGIFLLPLFILVYFCGTSFSLLWLLLVPSIMLLTSLPMGLMQMNPMQIFHTYFSQFGEYQTVLTLNYPNLYSLLVPSAETYGLLAPIGVGVLAVSFCIAAVWMIRRKIVLEGQGLLLAGAWCVLMCTYFLPCMHDRYALVGELLLLAYALLTRKPSAVLAVGLGSLATLNAYASYLASPLFPTGAAMIFLASALLLTTRELYLSLADSHQ